MIYQYRQPSSHLKSYIRDYVLAHFHIDANQRVPLKPFPAKPQGGILFLVKSFLIASNPSLATTERREQVLIVGQQEYRQSFLFSHEFLMIDVIFQPGALSKLLGMPMTELLNRHLDATLLLVQEIRSINDRLANTGCYKTMFGIIEDFLWEKIRRVTADPRPIDKIGEMILDNPHSFNLDHVAKQACLSHRQFERRFLQQVGIPPRFYQRLGRFRKAFETKLRHEELSWQDVAWRTGYSDYQHLVRDCRQFSGNTPNELMREHRQSPSETLGIKLQFYREEK